MGTSAGKPEGNCNICLIWTGLELDRVVPVCFGGKNEVRNIQWICPSCHRAKSNEETRLHATERMSTPEMRTRASEWLKRHFADPSTRQRLSEWATKFWSDPERKEKMSELQRAAWSDPEKRKAFAAACKERYRRLKEVH